MTTTVYYPSFNEYQAVLQSPQHCFRAPELKFSHIETDLWGLPRVRSGGFALTYKLSSSTRHFAVRCFHRHVPDRTFRYLAISNFLQENSSDILIPIRYLTHGVLVRGKWFPITYMDWIEGETLESCVVQNVADSGWMQGLANELRRVVAELERLGIAHGDLSHRNILVQGKKMSLVDYDGMFVPGLQGRESCEIGNIHFQLPARSEKHFDARLDRFSAIVIYLALEALARDASLWERYETGGEGLLFQRQDFLQPYQSALLQEIENLPGLKTPVDQFRRICTSPLEMTPSLADFIAARPVELVRSEIPVKAPAPIIAYNSSQRTELLNAVGKVVTVVGRINDVFLGTSLGGQPHAFLNFGNWREKCFTIVVWNEALELLRATHRHPREYLNRWVSVRGLLTSYKHRPQIAISVPTEIHLLQDEYEARSILSGTLKLRGSATVVRPASKPLNTLPRPVLSTTQADTFRAIQGSLDHSREVLERLEKLYTGLQITPRPGKGR